MKLGIDVGYGFTKTSGGVSFPSILGPGRERRLKGGLAEASAEELDVSIGGERYFVGTLAQRESYASASSLSKDSLAQKRIFLLTAAALSAERDWQAMQVVTGLPISDYRQQRREIAETMKGCASLRIGQKTRNIEIANIAVFPQGAGALWGELLDLGGQLVDTPLAGQKIGVVDIGYRDTNWCVLDSLEYVDRESDSAQIGLHNAHKAIQAELKDQGKELLLHDVGRYVERHPDLAERHYKDLAERILGALSASWNISEKTK